MDSNRLIDLISGQLPRKLARDLVGEFQSIRQDVATGTLGRTSAGKFVETLVQVLQYLESGQFDEKPSVDEYLRKLESRAVPFSDSLRICAARIGRAMYSLRSKRNIAHKGDIDPNMYDLRFLLGSAQWILAELVRLVSGGSMEDAGRIVEQIQAPVGGLVEDFGDTRLVLEALTAREEILVLLHSAYPDPVAAADITVSMGRCAPKTVRNNLGVLWRDRAVFRDADGNYKLTQRGFSEAMEVIRRSINNNRP